MFKRCSQCEKDKPLADFSRNRKAKDGYQWLCKECINERAREYWKKYPERRKKRAETARRWKEKHPHHHWAIKTLNDHRARDIDINISIEILAEVAKGTTNCFYCGEELNWVYGSKGGTVDSNSPSLDRVNNETFINEDNIMVICYTCNKTKGQRTMEEFIDYCQEVVNRLRKKEAR